MIIEWEVRLLAGELPERQLPRAGDIGLQDLHSSGVGVAGGGVGGQGLRAPLHLGVGAGHPWAERDRD